MNDAQGDIQEAIAQLGLIVKGQGSRLRWLLAAYLCGRHVLLEDRPGTGKTTLAKGLGRTLGLKTDRVQFTPDLLPSDILGVSVYEAQHSRFSFHRGPIFTQIFLADEINRCSPRTQAALLEAMEEKQVTLDGEQHDLDQHFFVIATQNPFSYHGTFPLPEAQLDRFGLQFSLGYPSRDDEIALLSSRRDETSETKPDKKGMTEQSPWALAQRQAHMAAAAKVHLADDLCGYIVDLCRRSREHPRLRLGASPRVSLDLMAISRACAYIDGRDFVLPELIQELWLPCARHRVCVDSAHEHDQGASSSILEQICSETPLPK
jgi:MoxR-like ATPase